MKVDLYFWTLILKWGVIIRYLNFGAAKGRLRKKKNDYLSFEYDFPRKDYFCSGNSQIVAVFQIFFTAKVGGKCPHPLFLDEAVPNQKYQPFFLKTLGY